MKVLFDKIDIRCFTCISSSFVRGWLARSHHLHQHTAQAQAGRTHMFVLGAFSAEHVHINSRLIGVARGQPPNRRSKTSHTDRTSLHRKHQFDVFTHCPPRPARPFPPCRAGRVSIHPRHVNRLAMCRRMLTRCGDKTALTSFVDRIVNSNSAGAVRPPRPTK